jgi:hypothetical protein
MVVVVLLEEITFYIASERLKNIRNNWWGSFTLTIVGNIAPVVLGGGSTLLRTFFTTQVPSEEVSKKYALVQGGANNGSSVIPVDCNTVE